MHILYVEDHQDTAEVTKILLQRAGHRVDVVHSVADAIAICTEMIYDLWIVDITLPDGHGGDLVRKLRRMADARAIALTGRSMPDEAAEGLEDGFDAYLTKPVAIAILLSTIAQLSNPTRNVPAALHGDLEGIRSQSL